MKAIPGLNVVLYTFAIKFTNENKRRDIKFLHDSWER